MHSQKTPKIRVLVRKRPLSKKQQLKGQNDIIKVQSNQSVLVHEQKYKVDLTPYTQQYKFNFDGVYDQFATNQQIYLTSIRPLVDCAFDGARVSCFAYGQTGSGKTHTMLGDGMNVHGMYLLAAADIFKQLQQYQKLSVWISFYQIYCGKLYDLLNQRNILFARQDAKNNVNIVGLSQRKISSVQNIMQIIDFGTGVRVTAQNGTNVDSSRSHAILQITLKNGNKVHGKISFIDLAGSERAADHADQLQKQTRIDGAQINKSLLALKQCIRALDQNKNHTPFRGSKLTMVLKDSFTGYCRTVMIGNISPNSSSCENTLNTLKYADRVKELKKPNKEQHMLQLDNLDQLSKQLMLPRQMVNHKKYQNKVQTMDNNDHQNDPLFNYGSNNNHLNHQGNVHQISHTVHNKKYHQKHQQPLFTKSNRISNPIPQAINSPYKQPFSKYQVPYQNKNLVQQQQPQNLSYQSLQSKHQNFIQVIIQEEQQLMKTHQKHINTTIDLVKQQMFLMGEADKIGSNVQQYLNNLQIVLERQLSSIKQVKDKVIKMKKNLNQSKRIEQLYIQASKKMFQNNEPEISLLDDQDHLFN